MRKLSFTKTPLAASVGLALGVTAMAPALAQSDSAEPIEEITVTGIRNSLLSSMNTKRNSRGVVDAITAEDIGKFPDTNLAESLQRITGVSIDRSRGEGSKVTVRGFGPQFNLVTLNGRQMPTHSSLSRSFDFADLAAEGISAVEVFKTSNAALPTGGIGSTINIKTTKPLDLRNRVMSFGVKTVHDTSTNEGSDLTPEISGIYGDTFADGTIGISLSAIYQERDNGLEKAVVNGWTPSSADVQCCDWGNGAVWGAIPDNANQINRPAVGSGAVLAIPQQLQYVREEFNRKRINSQLTLQWAPTDTVITTLDYTFARNELKRSFHDFSSWFAWGNAPVQFSEWDNSGDIVEYNEFNGASDTPMGSGFDATKNTTESLGFNVEWRPTDRLGLEFDFHDSTAKVVPDSELGSSMTLAITSGLRESTFANWTTDLPELRVGIIGGGPLSVDDMVIGGSAFTNNWENMNIQQAKIAASFDFNDIASINFGVQTTEVDNRSASTTVQRDTWGGVGAPGDIADLLSVESMAGWFDEIPGGSNPDRQDTIFTFDPLALIQRARELAASGVSVSNLNTVPGTCGDGFCPSFDSRVGNFVSDKRTAEDQIAVFAQLNLDLVWGDKPVNLDIGLRYEDTNVDSRAQVPQVARLDWITANEVPAVTAQDANGNALLTFTDLKGGYDDWLPNVDFNIEIVENVLIRASYSKTIARPGYNAIQGGITVASPCRVDGCDAFSGNPGLAPLQSDNIDFSVEWYFDEASYAAVGYFKKKVDNFLGDERVDLVLFPDLTNPATGGLAAQAAAALGTQSADLIRQYIFDNFPNDPGVDVANGIISGTATNDPVVFTLQRPVNEKSATIDGWELAIQHTFGESGFGAIVNATFVDANVQVDVNSLDPQFALSGLSDSANFIGFYDKNGIQARVAYNWRDDFLGGFGQQGSNDPRFTESYGQWDLNASYDINDQYTVFVEGINVTGETTREHARRHNMLLQAVQTGPRYNFGFRGRF